MRSGGQGGKGWAASARHRSAMRSGGRRRQRLGGGELSGWAAANFPAGRRRTFRLGGGELSGWAFPTIFTYLRKIFGVHSLYNIEFFILALSPITIPPTVNYYSANRKLPFRQPFFFLFLKYFDEKVIAQDFLGRGNLMP